MGVQVLEVGIISATLPSYSSICSLFKGKVYMREEKERNIYFWLKWRGLDHKLSRVGKEEHLSTFSMSPAKCSITTWQRNCKKKIYRLTSLIVMDIKMINRILIKWSQWHIKMILCHGQIELTLRMQGWLNIWKLM